MFQDSHKQAVVRPWIKIPSSLDPLDIKLYRPISNLILISKTVKHLAVRRLNVHVNQYFLVPDRQSAYRQHHSTETAIAIIHNDIASSTDVSLVFALLLLEVRTAFDTIDHTILLDILSECFRVKKLGLVWFRLYHTGHKKLTRPQLTAWIQYHSPAAFRRDR